MMMRALLCALLVSTALAYPILPMTSYEDRCLPNYVAFAEPDVVQSVDGLLETTLVVDITRYQGVFAFTTRLFNGSFPGPTIRVMPGDKVRIKVINNLGDQVIDNWDSVSYHSPNTTSLHVHGVHVSPLGSADMVFDGIGPGHDHLYEYTFPEDHYPGTHWYHAHYHGSVTFQVMSGMAGALIVDAPEGWMPAEYEDVQQHIVILQNIRWDIQKGGFMSVSTEIGNAVNPEFDACEDVGQTSVYVVNGLYQPFLTMEVGEYRILQLIHAAGDVYSLELVMSNPEICSMYTIAKDGVYFDKAVAEHMIFLWAAARVDVLIHCRESGNYSLVANGSDPANMWFYDVEDGITRVSQTLMWFHVMPSSNVRPEVSYDEVYFPPKPFYLQDLIDYPDEEIAGIFEVVGNYDLLSLNGERFTSPTNYSFFLELGKVYELHILADNYTHPMHLHINHFQIVGVELYGDEGDYNQPYMFMHSEFLWNIGEWRDTAPTVAGYRVRVRFRTDTWWGPMLYHCHYLPHADKGMMMVFFINPPAEQPENDPDYSDNADDFYTEEQRDNIESDLQNQAADIEGRQQTDSSTEEEEGA